MPVLPEPNLGISMINSVVEERKASQEESKSLQEESKGSGGQQFGASAE